MQYILDCYQRYTTLFIRVTDMYIIPRNQLFPQWDMAKCNDMCTRGHIHKRRCT